jgi:uncharacterized protein (TIGR02145 family)
MEKIKQAFLKIKEDPKIIIITGVVLFLLLLVFSFLIISSSKISPPTDVRLETRGYDRINLTWIDEEENNSYNIYRSLSLTGDYEKIETVENRHYLDKNLEPETSYYYKITSLKEEKESDFSSTAHIITDKVGEVADLKAEEVGSSYVALSWGGFEDSNGYIIYRTEDVNMPYTMIGSTTKESYIDTNLEGDTTYYYTVSQIIDGRESDYGNQKLEVKTDYYWSCGYAVSDKGELYNTVMISDQCWFSENLNYPTASGSWCYNDETENCSSYGRLYDFETATAQENICPEGWRVPSDDDFKKLEQEIGVDLADLDAYEWRGEDRNIGDRLKVEKKCSEKEERFCGAVGFDAEMGGVRDSDGRFLYLGTRSFFWTSDSVEGFGWVRGVGSEKAGVYRNLEDKNMGYFVRCIKN